jgi:hypothetical protein
MNAIMTSAQILQHLRLPRPAAIPQTPLAPTLGARATAPRLQQSSAFSLYADGMPQPQGPFSFIQPDVPADRKSAADRRRPLKPAAPTEDEETDQAFGANSGKAPRFRSALEQVSYLTNEYAEKRWK